MQLQIQTSKPQQKPQSPQNSHAQLPSIKDLFSSPKILTPSQTLLSQLRQIQLTVKADYHYLTKLRKNTFKALYEEDYEAQISVLEKGFLAFKLSKLQSRKSKYIFRNFIVKLSQNCQYKKYRKQQIHNAKVFYEQGLLRKVFREVFSMIRTKKKSQKLDSFLRKQQSAQFIHFLKQVSRQTKKQILKNEETEDQVDKIYQKQLCKKIFNSWQIFCKSERLLKLLKYKALKRFIHKLIEDKRQTNLKIENFQHNQFLRQKKFIFDCFKETKLQAQCREWHKYRLQKLYFRKWLEHHSLAQQQKQIQESNEIILQHFLQKKDPQKNIKMQHKYFRFWKSCIQFEKEQKKENSLMKSFAQLKQKEYLERKYFEVLKNNRNYEKSIRFCHNKLKQKAFKGLKRNLIAESKRLEKILKFVQKRTIGKYFDRIQLFNQHQNSKINKFQLEKAWFKFTFKITLQYFQKSQKAQNYHEISLKFKSLFAMNKNVQVHKKEEYCAFHLNIELPLKRWSQRFRLRKFVYLKEFYQMKRVFFEWKLASVRKLLSKEKEKITSELCVQSRIDSRKRLQKQSESLITYQDKSKHSSSMTEEQISFFKKMDEASSQEEDDHVTKRVDSLLTKIKTKRSQNKKQLTELQSYSGFSNERLMFANETLSGKGLKSTYEKVRLPTWSSPGNDYRVSVFSEDAED